MTIAFDIYGTLINTSGVYTSLKDLIGDKADEFMETWRNKQLEYSYRKGLMDVFHDFAICTQQALDYACLKHGCDLDQVNKNSLLEEYKTLPAFKDVKKGLAHLKDNGHKLIAFSNGSKKAVRQLLEHSKIDTYFDKVVSVEDVEVFKPSPKVYQHLLDDTQSEKSTTWLISSNPFDVLGAASFGLQTAWIQRTADTILDPWEFKPNLVVPDVLTLSQKIS